MMEAGKGAIRFVGLRSRVHVPTLGRRFIR